MKSLKLLKLSKQKSVFHTPLSEIPPTPLPDNENDSEERHSDCQSEKTLIVDMERVSLTTDREGTSNQYEKEVEKEIHPTEINEEKPEVISDAAKEKLECLKREHNFDSLLKSSETIILDLNTNKSPITSPIDDELLEVYEKPLEAALNTTELVETKEKQKLLKKKLLSDICCQFRSRIQLKTCLAFGVKHAFVFTGKEAISLIHELGQSHFPNWSREEAAQLCDYLMNEFWLILPCSLQMTQSQIQSDDNENLFEFLNEIKEKQDTKEEEQDWKMKKMKIFDNENHLYRLFKHSILEKDFSSSQFDSLLRKMKSKVSGIERVVGKVGWSQLTWEDGYFEIKSLKEWLEKEMGQLTDSECQHINKILQERKFFHQKKFSTLFYFSKLQ